jgi:protein transport protein SEC61 subunit gamma-like protein
MSDAKQTGIIKEVFDFYRSSKNFIKNCEKPDKKEFFLIAKQCAIGFAVMGSIGFIIKLVFLMINNILLS